MVLVTTMWEEEDVEEVDSLIAREAEFIGAI